MKKILLLVLSLLVFAIGLKAQTTIDFDDGTKWTAGSGAITSYFSDHTYVDGLFSATGGPALRNTTAAQDGFPGALGTYSWRLTNTSAVDWRITIASGGVSTFSVDIRRWDASPTPDLNLEYSTDGGTVWTLVSVINNTTLSNTSDWTTFNGTINNSSNNILIRLKANAAGERIMVDNFVWSPNTSSPSLTATPATLTGFSYIFGTGPSATQSYDLSGVNLTGAPGNITVTAPTNYEVSTDGVNFFASRTVAYATATLAATPIYVRLKSGLAIGAYNGELVANAGGGATTVNVTCSGDVVGPLISVSPASLSGMNYVFGSGPSSSQNYSLSGVNLTPAAGNLTVTAPADYEVSTDNSTFSASLNVAYAANTLAATTIYVRLISGLAVGTYNGELVTNAGGGATTQNISCGGEVTVMGAGCASDLIISEYIEGSGSEKYIEIYNGTGAAVDLSDYRLRLYTNGSATTSSDVLLSGMLADGAVIVYRNASAVLYPAATSNAAVNFNGDDAVALYRISTTSNVDIIGTIGEDPGSAWTSGSHSTADKTLVRNSNVYGGVTVNPVSGFPTLASEWTLYNQDDISHLGSHTMTCFSNTITTGTVSAPPFTVGCSSTASGTVDFTSTDAFTGNTYTAQLSNASGSFASPISIGTLVSDANSGTINITIPGGLPTGAGYKIRVVSSSPAVVGTESAAFTITLTGGPCSCFEIESILVDACDAGNEGRNEMFRFAVGGTPINTSDISVTWPNVANAWQGICQNATTAGIVSDINATIVAGGSLVEPVGGVIPAGSEVMFFTNTNFNYTMFDFSTLNYTLVAIFQCPDNTPGHFVNYTTPGPVLRTLDMNVAGCGSDAVTYDASLLYNGDGATVDFDVPGNPTYSLTGNCTTVPIYPVPIDLLFFKATCVNNGVELDWATGTETNNDYFTLESSDGRSDFVPFAIVDGAGNSNQMLRYNYFDSNNSKYYRLKQTDFDGAYSYSNIEAVNCSKGDIQLFPTLITEGSPLFILGDVNQIGIYDMLGNVIDSKLVDNQINGLPAGMYFIIVNNSRTFKVVVQ
ncbi:MAG: hypothetical protein CVU11_14875 [Bacteroidetes bacterium HGW-Bacteroidetes-6]|jgi:hypothetical protein|nr:MAG: hypothetical protein CVU11_14875 [Bacteroidetes bacterium HGW-Bacteroidetes-6]